MTNKEKITEYFKQLKEVTDERTSFYESITNEKGEICLTAESIPKIQNIDNKIKEIQQKVGEISLLIAEEERETAGYTVFGNEINSEGLYEMSSRVIPIKLKEKFIKEFDIMNATNLPEIKLIDEFLEKIVSDI